MDGYKRSNQEWKDFRKWCKATGLKVTSDALALFRKRTEVSDIKRPK